MNVLPSIKLIFYRVDSTKLTPKFKQDNIIN